jgi:alkanesulfonate monooxygenase SsuD/methylene tetrahydromethanopterin reductase-like flavin-dependent oxidoreductase (luciferase family)
MKLGYFTMPVHPQHRAPSDTLAEDREAIILADRLGFHDAFVGEHLTDKTENVTSSLLFLGTLIASTKSIKLGTGTCNLSHSHPVLIAAHAAMFDHLAKGRFIFGISPGALASDAEALGILDRDRNKMFADAIDTILAIWQSDAPYDIQLADNQYRVTITKGFEPSLGLGHMYKPYQNPRPEIVGTVVAPGSNGAFLMGQRDFHPMSANFLPSRWLASHWESYEAGKQSVGVKADRAEWRVARTIFVGDDQKTVRAYGGGAPDSPYRFYMSQIRAKLFRSGRQGVFRKHQDQPDSELTVDHLMDEMFITGTEDEVVDQLLELHDQLGGFGEIVYCGLDWVDPELARRSMELMATRVMPKINAQLAARAERAPTSVALDA